MRPYADRRGVRVISAPQPLGYGVVGQRSPHPHGYRSQCQVNGDPFDLAEPLGTLHVWGILQFLIHGVAPLVVEVGA